MKTPFLGAHTVSRSTNLADAVCINLYPELVSTKDAKDVGALFMTPGLDLLVTVGSGPIRGMHVAEALSTLYVVSGNAVYSVNTQFVGTLIGTFGSAVATTPVSIIDNGTQVLIVDGARGTLIQSGALSTVSFPFANPLSATYQDGFGLVAVGTSATFYQSNLFDLSTWNALNFATASGRPDLIVALASMHREAWIIEQNNTEIWINAGLPNFVFQRLQGVNIELGCGAQYSVVNIGESLIWLSSNEQGQGIVVQFAGYQPRRISTHEIEQQIAALSTVSDAIGYSYQQQGHVFYVLTFPTGNLTLVYDVMTGLWHRRAALSAGALNRHWGNAGFFFAGKNVIGDYQNGNLYAYNLNTLTDNGTTRKWVRSWRALPKPVMKPTRFPNLQIDMETGATSVPPGTNPQCMFRWSDDGGHRWSEYRYGAVGPQGKAAQRVKFNRLGSTRRSSGLDRIFELSATDPFKVALIGAEFVD